MALYDDNTFFPGCANPKPPYFLTAYEIAVKHGFRGTEEEWLESLTAWALAKQAGFDGTLEEWVKLLANPGSGSGTGGADTETDEEGNTHVSGGGNTIVNVQTPVEDTDAANKGYVDTVVQTQVVEKVIYVETKEDGTKVEHVSGGGTTIVNVQTPVEDTDAANKEYVDTVVKTEVVEKVIYVETKEDGSEVEHISGGGTTIVNVAAPVENTDAVNKEYADAIKETAEAAVKRAGDTMEGILSMGGFRLTNVATPSADADAVNKAYADAGSVARNVLFTNSDTASEYGETTISASRSGYDKLTIELSSETGIAEIGTLRKTVELLNTDGLYMIYDTFLNGTTVVQLFRGITLSGDSFKVSACGMASGGTISEANKCLIPTKIIGIKYGGGAGGAPSAEGVLF